MISNGDEELGVQGGNDEEEEEKLDYSWTPVKEGPPQDKLGGTGDGEPVDEDDVYGDLFVNGALGESLLRVKAGELEERTNTLEEENARLKVENCEAKEERERLTEERAILVRNISRLFKTAKLEIDRKTQEIKDLQAAIRQLNRTVESRTE